jgi:hypothetical protein
MKIRRKLLSVNNIFVSLVVIMQSLIKVTNQSTIVTATPWNYQCDRGIGVVPHSTDCQRFWVCQESFSNLNLIKGGLRKSSNLKVHPHLFKCPDGYQFDITIRFCQREERATCGVSTTTSTTTTTERSNNRDIGLFGLLFGLP